MIEYVKANLSWLIPAVLGVVVIAYPALGGVLARIKPYIPLLNRTTAPQPPSAAHVTSLDAVHDALRVLYAQHLEIGVTPEQADAWLREGMLRAINGVAK